MRKIRRGDTVVVIRGDAKIKGRRGKVLKVDTKNDRVVVEGLNYMKKHLRRSQDNPRGGRVEREAPMHASNVMLICPHTSKPTRVGFMIVDEAGEKKKKRVSKISGKVID